MQIEVFTPDEPLGLLEEVWVRVLANTVVDWPFVHARLTVAQKEALWGLPLRPTQYFPGQPDSSDHDYKFEDHWVFRKEQR